MGEQKRYAITLHNGRVLEVAEAGDQNAPAVFIHNGTPSAAGLLVEHIDDAIKNGLRLISYGRPGYGKSTRQAGRSVADAAKDTADLADALGIDRFATWGISGGGPHALACAALLRDRVVAASCLAGVAPYGAEGLDFLAGMGEDNVEEFGAAIKGEEALMAYLESHTTGMADMDPQAAAENMSSLLSGVDRDVFTGSFGAQLATLMKVAVQAGLYGWLDDDLAFAKDWGFDFSRIEVPLQIWQGTQDLMVPYAHGEWLVRHIPQAEPHLTEEDGHLTLYLRRIPEVHQWLASHF